MWDYIWIHSFYITPSNGWQYAANPTRTHFSISVTCITHHTGPTALRHLWRMKKWLSVLLKDTSVRTGTIHGGIGCLAYAGPHSGKTCHKIVKAICLSMETQFVHIIFNITLELLLFSLYLIFAIDCHCFLYTISLFMHVLEVYIAYEKYLVIINIVIWKKHQQ